MATHQQDQLIVVNPTSDAFTVHWAKNPYTLTGGQQMIWPRFLAEHFAKHLADSILLKREAKEKEDYKATGRPLSEYIAPALLNNRTERPKVVDSIIKGVYTYYTPQGAGGPAAEIQRKIDDWNKQQPQPEQEKVTNMGAAADPLLGVLNDDDDDEVANPPQPTPTPAAPTVGAVESVLGVTTPPPAPAPPVAPPTPDKPAENPLAKRNRLMKEAKSLGIKTNPNMTTEQLEGEIKKQFA